MPRGQDRSPIWPRGFVGSLAHDDRMCVAAIALRSDVPSLGVDIEPNEPLDDNLVPLVSNPPEQRRYSQDILRSRLLFVIKEATYKAVYPLDKCFLDFHDIHVDLDARLARTSSGRTTKIFFTCATHVAALAVVT